MDVASLVLSIVAVAVSTAAAVAAIGLWRSARKANNIAAAASASAAEVARLDSDRRHDELEPIFEIRFVRSPQRDRAELEVALVSGIQELDEVTFRIVDEKGTDHWAHGLPQNLTQAEAEMFVWGSWEFNALAAGEIADRRTSRARSHSRRNGREWDRLSLARTRPGPWMQGLLQEDWERQHQGPIRLRIDCRAAGHKRWSRLVEVHAHDLPSLDRP